MGMIKNGWDLLDLETLESGVFPKWFDELSGLVEWYLDADSDGITVGLLANVLCIFDI